MPTTPADDTAAQSLYDDALQRGATLHAAGELAQALIAFEEALALQPANVNAASACATLLYALSRPAAAYRTLLSVEGTLMQSADGAANLAIAAEGCGDIDHAKKAYHHALALEPTHLRSLNNVGLMAATQQQWDAAIECGQQCVAHPAAQASHHVNLSDFLCGARRYADALAVLDEGDRRFPGDLDLRIRRPAVLAFNGDFEASRTATAALDAAARAHLRQFLSLSIVPAELDHQPRPVQDALPDAQQLFCGQAYEAMTVCNWQDNEQLTATLRQMLATARQTGQGRDWRDAQFYGLMLDLTEDELADIRNISIAKIGSSLKATLPPFEQGKAFATVRRLRKDDRIHIGMAVQSLRDARHAHALKKQLALHDVTRFAIHVYSPTRHPDLAHAATLRPQAASVVEIAHMSDLEAAGRMRLDALDVFVDMAFDTAWCRPEIPAMRVAPVQVRQLTWHRHHPARPCDYNLSDTFVHPDGLDLAPYGAVVRLPHTCWLALNDEAPANNRPTRADAGLPEGALVLASSLPSVMLDPLSFATWMKILRALPDAVLWLPAYNLTTAGHLVREAKAAGVSEGRLLFAARMSREESLGCLQQADLFLDTLRFNTNLGLADALRLGVPALSCAGNSMASRLGGSIIRAAGLPEGVTGNRDAYLAEALRLGRNPEELSKRRQQLQSARSTAPLFDLPGRVREWEAAWTVMAERSRAGLPPAAFDVQAAS